MKTTTKLAISSLKAEKIRSILTGIAIFLTTVLITVIALGGNAAVQEQKTHAAETYGEYYGLFSNISPEEIEKVKLHSQFYDVGIQTYAGEAICKGYRLPITAMDSTIQKLLHFKTESGNAPKTENDIAAQREFFEVQGINNPQIGDNITLSLRINDTGEIVQKDFVICGFLPSSEMNNLSNTYGACVSEAFIDANIADKKERHVTVGFKVLNDENLNGPKLGKKILSLGEELGLKESQIISNDKYLLWAFDPGTEVIVPCVCIICIIMIVSVLVIYNIFNVVIVQKIHEYGRLKTIGANRKQLKHMVRMEGFLLSLFTIPAGILFGILILKLFFHFLMGKNIPVFSLPLTIVIIILAFFTVFLSMHKPIKLVAKVSPVEAIRYEAGEKELSRKGKTSVTVLGLTMSNLSLHKKRTVTTILTMGLSCVLFVVIANVAGNMDAGRQTREDLEYGKFRIELDCELNDKTYPENNLYEVQKQELLNKDFINQLKSIDGVTDVRTRKQVEVFETNENTGESFYTSIVVLDEKDFEWLVRNAERGVVNYQNTAEQNGVIYMWDYFMDEEYSIGDNYKCEILDGDKRILFNAPIVGSCGHSNDSPIAMTEKTYEQLGIEGDMTGIVFVDCSDEAEASVRTELEQIVGSMEHISMTCFEDSLKLNTLSISFTKNASYTFLVILSIIGFMNMANTMITNILTRKREFGVMQAIGMSNRQLNKMLQIEGLVFTIGTLLISLTLGNLLGYLAFLFCKEQGFIGLFEYHFPILEIGGFVIGIVVLQVILALVLSKNVKKESLVERIRYEG